MSPLPPCSRLLICAPAVLFSESTPDTAFCSTSPKFSPRRPRRCPAPALRGMLTFGIPLKLTLLIVALRHVLSRPYVVLRMSIDSWIICFAALTADAFN